MGSDDYSECSIVTLFKQFALQPKIKNILVSIKLNSVNCERF